MEDQATMQAAEQELNRRVADGEDGFTAIMAKQVSGLLHAGMDHADVAANFFNQAVEIITPMAPPRGSAQPIKPVFEMYGEVLNDLGRHEAAIKQFEISLERMPNRPRSLSGMAQAQAATGNAAAAGEYYQMLVNIWEGDEGFIAEARSYLAGNAGGGAE